MRSQLIAILLIATTSACAMDVSGTGGPCEPDQVVDEDGYCEDVALIEHGRYTGCSDNPAAAHCPSNKHNN
jgi:hypothetical protein